MPNSHAFILIHYVFTPLDRQPMFANADRKRLLDYIAAIIKNKQGLLYEGFVMRDHVHLLAGIHPKHSVAEMAQAIKANSSKFINEQRLIPGRFSWSQGYGAFSCSRSQMDVVRKYIQNQVEHHKAQDFAGEYRELLTKHDLDAGFGD